MLTVRDIKEQVIIDILLNKELLDFAELFSNNYKFLDIGYFSSEKKYYQIVYKENFDKEEAVINKLNPARISRDSGVIEINKSAILSTDKYSINFLYYLIVWCAVRKNTVDEYEADAITVEVYKRLKKSKKDLLMGFLEMASHSSNVELNKKRYELILLALQDYEKEIN